MTADGSEELAEWVSYADLAKIWNTSKPGARKRVARIRLRREVPERKIKGRPQLWRAAILPETVPSVPPIRPVRPVRPGDTSQ